MQIVDSSTGQIFLFIKSSKIRNGIRYLIQDYVGDIYTTAGDQILKISYARQTITRIAGGPTGYKDASLLSCQFSSPYGLLLANKDTLLVADHANREVRMLNLRARSVKKLRMCPGNSPCLQSPMCLLMNGNSVYIGQKSLIARTDCEYIYANTNLHAILSANVSQAYNL